MNDSQTWSGRLWLFAATVFMLVGWLIVLPAIAARPGMSAYLQRLDEQGIDASAMFYTELEMMPKLLERLDRGSGWHRVNPE